MEGGGGGYNISMLGNVKLSRLSSTPPRYYPVKIQRLLPLFLRLDGEILF